MARTAMRDPTGRWSLAQAATAAGITYRTARTITDSGYLNKNDLAHHDVVLLRVAAALLDTPLPPGETRTSAQPTTATRNHQALRLTRDILTTPNPEARLVITPTTARLTQNTMTLMGAIGEAPTDPLLILPIGEWVQHLHTTTSDAPRQVAS